MRPGGAGRPSGIIDRENGALTLWPAYDTDALTSHYNDYKRGEL